MRLLRSLFNLSALFLVAGLAGGLALGYLLSQEGGWLTPAPWLVYLALLSALVVAISWLDERRRLRAAEAAWPLPDGYMTPDLGAQPTPLLEPAALLSSAVAVEDATTRFTPERQPAVEQAPRVDFVGDNETVLSASESDEEGDADPSAAVDTWTVDGDTAKIIGSDAGDGQRIAARAESMIHRDAAEATDRSGRSSAGGETAVHDSTGGGGEAG